MANKIDSQNKVDDKTSQKSKSLEFSPAVKDDIELVVSRSRRSISINSD